MPMPWGQFPSLIVHAGLLFVLVVIVLSFFLALVKVALKALEQCD